MSLAYKVEELLALRDSVSESAVSIDKFADEDVIKEHVLRPSASASANLASRSSGRSLRPPTEPLLVPLLAPTAPFKRPSPTPSIKRGKAERLLKEHGSPPGMRVTAGGRVVPSDLPLLGTSRCPDNDIKSSNLCPIPGNTMSAQTESSTNTAARIDVIGGQPVIIIGDRVFAIPAVDANTTPVINGSVTRDLNTRQASDPPTLTTQGSMPGVSFGPSRANSTSPFAGLDLASLKAQQTLKKQELRTVEQTEVLQACHQTEAWRAGMIEKKRCLIVELDALRKSITSFENDKPPSIQPNAFPGPIGAASGPPSLPSFASQLQQQVSHPMYSFPAANPYAPLMMYQPPYGAFPSFPTVEPTPFVAPPVNPPHSPGSASRRSHAIEIKPPQEVTTKPALNPKSPTYEPPITSGLIPSVAVPTPSPVKQSPWRTREEPSSDRFQYRASLSQKPSLSSIDTTDFFPTNTHEHSSTRMAPKTNELRKVTHEDKAVPSTPEKNWPASPWNEAKSGRSTNNGSASKLTSWPQVLEKQRSSLSLRQSAATQPPFTVLERAPVTGAYAPNSFSSNNVPVRSDSDQHTGTEENWPFSRKTVIYVPSTYQEGYQAGYDHVGIPDSPEVLRGYVQGLLQFLDDESKKGSHDGPVRDLYARGIDSRTSSLRGLVAGSLPRDSAVSMSFNNGVTGNQEHALSPNGNLSATVTRDTAYSPQGSIKDVSGPNPGFNKSAYTPRQCNVSSRQNPISAGFFPDMLVSGRQAGFLSNENDTNKPNQDKVIASRADPSLANGSFSRHFSGAQLQNRGYGNTPLSSQRFYPSPKEMESNGFNGGNAQSVRPFGNHRLSGLDGAMDDLAEMIADTSINDNYATTGGRSVAAPVAKEVEHEEAGASCFKQSGGGKGKQKATASPAKSSGNGRDNVVSSPNAPSSPNKTADQSPAKAKIGHVANKFRRPKKDDPRTMSPGDKAERSKKWRQRFQYIKKVEAEEIEEYRKHNQV